LKNGKVLALEKFVKKTDKFFGKQWFLAIFAKFGSIWQPWYSAYSTV